MKPSIPSIRFNKYNALPSSLEQSLFSSDPDSIIVLQVYESLFYANFLSRLCLRWFFAFKTNKQKSNGVTFDLL